ncbi:hypothetical protein BGHDH14_bgh03224 [Blumeria hordei DH14]|uniref:DH domain-containing protein n=1 Tax=Blumeria graminis f. sp. hordei (strain DH14) TaxID=546991 RepID=N1J9L9_BLUG1|nr:hypothetical protein BGHDH14_bgh03224 [Blumeria hordei DH14]
MDLLATGTMALNFEVLSTPTCSRRGSLDALRKTSRGSSIQVSPYLRNNADNSRETVFDNVDLHENSVDSDSSQDEDTFDKLKNISALGLSFECEEAEPEKRPIFERFSLESTEDFKNQSSIPSIPFSKWSKNFERRASRRRKTVSCDMGMPASGGDLFQSPGTARRSAHKKSSSGSSFGFVTAVKSASISLASFSVAARSKRTKVSSRQQRTDRSSKASQLGRTSEDSSHISKCAVFDQAVVNRLLHRRRVLEEIINTEESYVADIKFLMHVYVTLLASMPRLSSNFRASINRNLNEILELHEEILGELHRVVPHSEYTQTSLPRSPTRVSPGGHQRWRSIDAVPENSGGVSWLQRIPGMTAEPHIAAEINRLFIYEEYGAKYELMIKDIGSTQRTIPQWDDFQKGLEALASSLSSINNQQDSAKKAMTVGDLLIKPIQRICRYQLLFSELLRQTPVCDCPDSHLEIETVMVRLKEATTEINQAADDPRKKNLMEKSWLLQDRIIFPDMPDTRSKSLIRSLGHIHLCGVLHVSWQTQDGVDGQNLICLLYRDYLLLASTPNFDQVYNVQACIELSEVSIEESDNGRGLQCYTVQFSWKIVFICDHQLFELTMSACSPKEELEWRSRLTGRSYKERVNRGDQILYSSLSLPVKAFGTIFGKPGIYRSIARCISVHRATTVGSISGLRQVIIKNTNSFKDSTSSNPINRSQSLFTVNRPFVIAPLRSERTRLEALLADVWTRDVLPFPGMAHRARSEHTVRASASLMMRKLSVASIASNFTKRSKSIASLQKNSDEDDEVSRAEDCSSHHSVTESSIGKFLFEEPENLKKSRLSVIQDEKENISHNYFRQNPVDIALGGLDGRILGSTCARVPKNKDGWMFDGHKETKSSIQTPTENESRRYKPFTLPKSNQMFISSINSDKEAVNCWDVSQSPRKESNRGKVNGKGKSVLPDGIRSLFR